VLEPSIKIGWSQAENWSKSPKIVILTLTTGKQTFLGQGVYVMILKYLFPQKNCAFYIFTQNTTKYAQK
jgi:uncharacterized protein YhbP (UPF0306 family)